jgi:hypothetical protein
MEKEFEIGNKYLIKLKNNENNFSFEVEIIDEIIEYVKIKYNNNIFWEKKDSLLIIKKLSKLNNFKIKNNIQRFSIRELISEKNGIIKINGIEYNIEKDGNWVMYKDIENLIEDINLTISKLNDIYSTLTGQYRNIE